MSQDIRTKLTAGVPLENYKLTGRQYGALGTDTATISGSYDGLTWEPFLQLAPNSATVPLSQKSADRYPHLKYTSSGTNTVWVVGVAE